MRERPHLGVAAALVLMVLGPPAAPADDDPMETDRPSFSAGTGTVSRGRIQIETGYTSTEDGDVEERTLGEMLIRLGLSEHFELRLGAASYREVDSPAGSLSGLEDSSVGVKIRLSDPLPDPVHGRPQVAVIVATAVPTGSDEFREPNLQPQMTVALGWGLSGRSSIGANIGYTSARDGGMRYDEFSGSLIYGRAMSERLGAYVEAYGLAESEGRDDTSFANAGVTFRFSRDAQIDLRAGAGLNSAAADYFVGLGGAWRW